MNLKGKTFRAVSNTAHGSINTDTKMHFTSDKGVVAAEYRGGTIVTGHVLGKRINETEMDLVYLSATISGEVKAGKAHAKFSRGEDRKLHMHMDWQWLTGDHSSGQSDWVLVS